MIESHSNVTFDLLEVKENYARAVLDCLSMVKTKEALKEDQSESLAKYWLGCKNYLIKGVDYQ